MKILSPLKAIHTNCIECGGGSSKAVRKCHITDCVLYPYRLGKNPNRKGVGGNKNLNSKKTSTEVTEK